MIRSILVLVVLALPASANDLFLSQLQLDSWARWRRLIKAA